MLQLVVIPEMEFLDQLQRILNLALTVGI